MGPGNEDFRKNPKFQNIAAGRKRKMKAAIITSSDKGYAGEREDISGQVMEDILKEAGYEIMRKVILPDDRQMLADEMLRMCQDGADLIMTTGGTGFSQRDAGSNQNGNRTGGKRHNGRDLVLFSVYYSKGHAVQSYCRHSGRDADRQSSGKPQSGEGSFGLYSSFFKTRPGNSERPGQ